MDHDLSRLDAAYPGLLPGYFTLIDAPLTPLRHRPWTLSWRDPSVGAPPDKKCRRKHSRRYKRLFQQYLEECAAACSIIFQYCDAIQYGDTIVVSAALSHAQFDRLAMLGATLEDLENDDPGEESDEGGDGDPDAEDGDVDEDCGRQLPCVSSDEETK